MSQSETHEAATAESGDLPSEETVSQSQDAALTAELEAPSSATASDEAGQAPDSVSDGSPMAADEDTAADAASDDAPVTHLDEATLDRVLEALLMASDGPVNVSRLDEILDQESPGRAGLLASLRRLQAACDGRSVELVEVASGWRYQVRASMASWIARMWAEKPARLSRAFLETLALVAYRQPITRAEIEDIRGVSVGSGVLRTLQERGWVKVVGHREVPGRPALYATTREFLDYFNLRSIQDLPALPSVPTGEMAQLLLPEVNITSPAAEAMQPVSVRELTELEPPEGEPVADEADSEAPQIGAA